MLIPVSTFHLFSGKTRHVIQKVFYSFLAPFSAVALLVGKMYYYCPLFDAISKTGVVQKEIQPELTKESID